MVVSLAKPELWNIAVDDNVMAELIAQLSVNLILAMHLDPSHAP